MIYAVNKTTRKLLKINKHMMVRFAIENNLVKKREYYDAAVLAKLLVDNYKDDELVLFGKIGEARQFLQTLEERY